MSSSGIFTAIIDTYNRPDLLKQAVNALLSQTYDNLEIIIVNNGATSETIDYLHKLEKLDSRIKLIHFSENQYSVTDPLKMIDTCLNAALAVAEGDYIWYQADDDLISNDYAEKMVGLFEDNPECTTAAAQTVTIDIDGNRIRKGNPWRNYRPRYMPGHLMVLDYLRGGRTLFRAPATIFTIKRESLVHAGGYHRSIPLNEIYGIVPFGITGFDETATFYFRRHEGQLNKLIAGSGISLGHTYIDLLNEWNIEERWMVHGPHIAKEVARGISHQACNDDAERFIIQFYRGRAFTCFGIARNMWRYGHFWKRVLILAKSRHPIRFWISYSIRMLFRLAPPIFVHLSPRLAKIRERVNR